MVHPLCAIYYQGTLSKTASKLEISYKSVQSIDLSVPLQVDADGASEDDALLAADYEAEREMDAEREMEAATRDEAEASGGLGTAAARAASDKKQTKAW